MTNDAVKTKRTGRLAPVSLERLPWWVLIVLLLGLLIAYNVVTSTTYSDTLKFLWVGVKLTILSTLVAYAVATVIGLITGLGRVSTNPIFYTVSTLYVEVVRGIPILVQLIYWAFVVTPLLIDGVNGLGDFLTARVSTGFLFNLGQSFAALSIQGIDMSVRGVLGLAVAYGAYEAEVFRAGIESIERGQMEAARSLGMSYFQAMRYVILPQAIRRVLPPLGNDFISMLKDSSLLSALAIRELTQLGKLNRARTFRTFETWNMVAFLYLVMTLCLSMGVKAMERRLSIE
ncbi:MAG: amino acid ABC transporter permease [Anaerolineales bacterium]|nr:MAG: amino acid ABC transporter permease [Anaerolineales bacterium]